MKIIHTAAIAFVIGVQLLGCKKNGGGGTTTPPPAGGHTAKWLVKDVMIPDGTGKLNHRIFNYNDTGLIIKIDNGLSANVSHPEDYAVISSEIPVYKSSGKLDSIKSFQHPGYTFVYVTNFSIQQTPFPYDAVHEGYSTFYFNVRGHNELDMIKSFTPPASTSGFNYSSTTSYAYNTTGGVQSGSVTNYYGNNEDVWAAYSSTGIPVANAFSNGTTIEQRLLYYIYGSIGAWDMLGGAWSNGTLESYTYSSGSKAIKSHFFNDYTVDANGNVSKIITSYAIDGPAFNSWVKLAPVTITYEKH